MNYKELLQRLGTHTLCGPIKGDSAKGNMYCIGMREGEEAFTEAEFDLMLPYLREVPGGWKVD